MKTRRTEWRVYWGRYPETRVSLKERIFWTLLGGISLMFMSGTLLFVLPLVTVVIENTWTEHWLLVIWSIGFFLLGLVFLNMANFYARLKRANPDIHCQQTRGMGFVGYVGWIGRSLLTDFHQFVAWIADADSGHISSSMRRYAAVTRVLHRFVLIYLVVILIGLVALGMTGGSAKG